VAVNGDGGSADGGGGFTDGGGGFGQGYASCGDDDGLIETTFLKNSYFSLKISGWRNN